MSENRLFSISTPNHSDLGDYTCSMKSLDDNVELRRGNELRYSLAGGFNLGGDVLTPRSQIGLRFQPMDLPTGHQRAIHITEC